MNDYNANLWAYIKHMPRGRRYRKLRDKLNRYLAMSGTSHSANIDKDLGL